MRALGKPQKSHFLNDSAIKNGWGVRGLPLIRRKKLFWGFVFYLLKKFRRPLSSMGKGKGKALMAPSLRK